MAYYGYMCASGCVVENTHFTHTCLLNLCCMFLVEHEYCSGLCDLRHLILFKKDDFHVHGLLLVCVLEVIKHSRQVWDAERSSNGLYWGGSVDSAYLGLVCMMEFCESMNFSHLAMIVWFLLVWFHEPGTHLHFTLLLVCVLEAAWSKTCTPCIYACWSFVLCA